MNETLIDESHNGGLHIQVYTHTHTTYTPTPHTHISLQIHGRRGFNFESQEYVNLQ